MKLLIYFKQGAPAPFINRYTHGPKDVKGIDLAAAGNYLLVESFAGDRIDAINLDTVYGYEVVE